MAFRAIQGCHNFLFNDRHRVQGTHRISDSRHPVRLRVPIDWSEAGDGFYTGDDIAQGVVLIEVPELEREVNEPLCFQHRRDLQAIA